MDLVLRQSFPPGVHLPFDVSVRYARHQRFRLGQELEVEVLGHFVEPVPLGVIGACIEALCRARQPS